MQITAHIHLMRMSRTKTGTPVRTVLPETKTAEEIRMLTTNPTVTKSVSGKQAFRP